MTGHTTKAIAAQGTKTDVAVTLERTVAKIAVQASTTAEFSERYSGRVRINSVVLSKAASRSNLIAQQTPSSPASSGTCSTCRRTASWPKGAACC